MTKFKNRYRIESNRLKGWDYGSNARYFITICCKDRAYFFGDITAGEMILSEIGEIADTYWQAVPNHFSNVILHNHIIKPDHMHGIIEIDKTAQTPKLEEQTANLAVSPNSIHPEITANKNKPSRTKNASEKWNPGTLGVIINQYKRICTIKARKINPNFGWQANYHDIIIRNQKSYQNISN